MTLRVAWGVTGAGDLLAETVAAMEALDDSGEVEVTVVLSRAAVTVVRWYGLWDRLSQVAGRTPIQEKGPNSPFIVGKLQTGRYDYLLVAPATANSVGKIVHGIADTLITNAVAQAVKADVPVGVLPVDQRAGVTTTTLPGGEKLKLKIRAVDIDNARRLGAMEGIRLLARPEEIAPALGLPSAGLGESS
jgi:archaeoflavoprotein AfpA